LANKNILLIEPGYANKYPPLGLMKIAAYHGPEGKRDRVTFVKGPRPDVLMQTWDRIYVTTLFSFEYAKIAETIDFALDAAHGQSHRVFVGGIAASLMPEKFDAEARWAGVRFIRGLLNEAPAVSLQLDDFVGELYADDRSGMPIEDYVPDYSILEQIAYTYPVRDAYFAYASRGCIRKCSFCGVPKLEGDLRETESLGAVIRAIEERHGAKKDLILMDNNIVASPKFKDVVAEIIDLGFTPGATLKRGRYSYKRRVDFNQGVDARILCKDPMYMRELSRIAIRPVRIAFDHWGTREPYEKSVRYAHEFGLDDLSNYMLYNFHDTPADLFRRMRLNVDLNEELNIRIYSFPMRYQPTNLPDRSHVSDKWTKYQLRSMQIILQATQGIVSGEPSFFRKAFGESEGDYEALLRRPHHFIFNRDWYDRGPGRQELDAYEASYSRLSNSERTDLLEFLSTNNPSQYHAAAKGVSSSKLRGILEHHIPPAKRDEATIWQKTRQTSLPTVSLTEDEIVEDAGLDDELTDAQLVSMSA
jgi:hypothetical protein